MENIHTTVVVIENSGKNHLLRIEVKGDTDNNPIYPTVLTTSHDQVFVRNQEYKDVTYVEETFYYVNDTSESYMRDGYLRIPYDAHNCPQCKGL